MAITTSLEIWLLPSLDKLGDLGSVEESDIISLRALAVRGEAAGFTPVGISGRSMRPFDFSLILCLLAKRCAEKQ